MVGFLERIHVWQVDFWVISKKPLLLCSHVLASTVLFNLHEQRDIHFVYRNIYMDDYTLTS